MNLRTSFVNLYRFILTRRYRLHIQGIDLLHTHGPKLILPNHPSYIDPQLLAVIVDQHCEFVPVVAERFLKIPIIKSFLKKWNAVRVSDFRRGNKDPFVLRKILPPIFKALEEEKSVIIYPAGQVQRNPYEEILNKQGAYLVVKRMPKTTKVIGVRIKGLWGSMWSFGYNGEDRHFVLTYLKGIFYFCLNFALFIPKRDVTFEFVDITEGAINAVQGKRNEFNDYLEEFYNRDGIEENVRVKYFFYSI